MLEQVSRVLSEGLVSVLGFYVISKLLDRKEKILKWQNILLLFILTIIPTILYKVEYDYNYTLIVYLLAIIVYKTIFKENIYKMIICTGIFILLLLASDVIFGIILFPIFGGKTSRNCWYVQLLANILVSIFVIILINIPKLQDRLSKLTKKVSKSKFMPVALFLSTSIIIISIFGTNFNSAHNKEWDFIVNSVIILLLILLAYIFIKEKSNYDKLSNEYDALYEYVKVFQDTVENEQLNIHEYKNQLAVIRAMTKEKKVKDKIDSLINMKINVNDDMVTSLKYIPQGGLKGLLYYKISIATKKKIKITIDVSKEVEKNLKQLTEEQDRDLTKILGIYLDNAIEATENIKKKRITLEVYQIDNDINFVISNTYNQDSIIHGNGIKGTSSKGTNRGSGLYFTKKLIDKNKFMTQDQRVMGEYYIQKFTLLNNNKNTLYNQ